MTVIALGFCIAAFYRTRRLRFSASVMPDGVDEHLLVISHYATILYDAIIIVALGPRVFEMTEYWERVSCGFRMLLAFLDIIEANLQTFVVMDAFHRSGMCGGCPREQRWGQALLGGLLTTNACLWMILSFQVRSQGNLCLLYCSSANHHCFCF